MKLRGQETRSASSYRSCEEGMTGSNEVVITFAIICSVISLLPAKLRERFGKPSRSLRMSGSPFRGGREGVGKKRGSPEG